MKKLQVFALAVSLLVGGTTIVFYSRGSHIRATESKPFPHEELVHTSKPFPHEEAVHTSKPFPHEEAVHTSKPFPHEEPVHTSKPFPHEEPVHTSKPFPHEEPVHTSKPFPHEEPVHTSKPFPHEEPVHTSPESMGSSQKPKHGYILTLEYSGQQGAGIQALVSQQCWVKSFNLPMHIVEPFVDNSKIGSISRYDAMHLVRLGHYFDIHHFNNVSLENGYPTLVSWEDFRRNAPRNVIVVWMRSDKKEKLAKILWDARNSGVQCYKNLHNFPGSEEERMKKLEFLGSENICVVRFADAPGHYTSSHIFTANEMYNVLFQGWNLEEVTLIFNLWEIPWCVPNPQLENPRVCINVAQEGVKGKLRPSPQLLRYAQQYEQLFLKPKNSLAVMIRAEHVLYEFGTGKGKASDGTLGIYSCMKQLVNLTRTLQNRLGCDEVFMTSDVGKFASATWQATFSRLHYHKDEQPRVIQAIKDTVSELYHQNCTFEEWEDSFSQVTGGIEDRGYTAALQRTIASRAECLVFVGGGTFQELALQDYLTNHPDPSEHCIHFVCGRENHVKEMQQIIAESRQG